MFSDHDKQFSLPQTEEKVLAYWRTNKIFEKSLKKGKGKKSFVFYEGPPGANGKPGIHHVLPRIFKDIVCRYKTMRGYSVPRKSGWDTHGLPIEIAAEKELGLKSKKDIEALGIAMFNQKCREVVWQHKAEWEKLTERIGFWLDLEQPYVTYDNDYIESLWWVIKQIADKKLFYRGHKVVPWCPRCGTGLSQHELGQPGVYKEVKDNTAYVKFKVKPSAAKKLTQTDKPIFILSWTTTPWTLPGNVALAVGSEIKYQMVLDEKSSSVFIIAGDLVTKVFGVHLGNGMQIFGNLIKGKDLVGLEYEPLFDIPALQNEASHKVYAADFVTTEDGTGVVHIAPMYGEDDYKLGKKTGLPQKHTVDEDGRFTNDVKELAGLPVKSKDGAVIKEVEDKIFTYLKAKNALLKSEPYLHEYPHCWRCDTPLLYYARTSWFVGIDKLQKELLAENAKINWVPEHFKNGRFGEWLRDAREWNFSRDRYWGTPLPAWVCKECEKIEVIGSREELGKHAIQRNNFFFMRHGEAGHILKGIFGPAIDTVTYTSHLTPKGKKQVEKTAKKLKSKKIDIIISSTLARAKETAEIVSKELGVNVVYRKDLIDINPGVFQGKKVKEGHKIFKNELEKFTVAYPDGENRNDVKIRMWRAIKDIDASHKGKNILIVSHADPLFMIRGALLGFSDEEILSSPIPKLAELYDIPWRPLPLDENGNLDFHRPYIDEIKLKCSACGGVAERTKEVADVWFDSGAMPFAQSHYPFENKELIDKKKFYPADYISEAVDQTRGWFYTLLAVSTLLGKERPYKNVICLGHINDKFGRKMSKSKGNVVDPWEMANKYGIDAVRWYFYTATPPGEPKLFDEADILKAYRRFHLILHNSLVFYETYTGGKKVQLSTKNLSALDRWILARLEETIAGATKNLEAYDIRGAALTLENFVDDLSRWYIRRSRRRLQRPESATDFAAASATLQYVFENVVRLTAPFVPFISESLAGKIYGKGEQSVHLMEWPKVTKNFGDKKLIAGMAEVRRVASVALSKRAESGVKVRQPLKTLRVKSDGAGVKGNKELLQILKDEVNVKEVVFGAKINPPAGGDVELDLNITPELWEEGVFRELVRSTQELRQDGGLRPKDKVGVMIEIPEKLRDVLTKNEKNFLKEVNAKSIEYKKSAKFSAEADTKIGEDNVWLAVRKI